MDAFELETLPVDQEILLRRFRESDAETLFETIDRNREHLVTFMHWMTEDYSVASAEEFITRSSEAAGRLESLGFGIFRRGKLVGSIGFVNFEWNSRRAELGYWVSRDEEGKGIVSKCCKVLIRYAFNDLKINRLEIRCAAKNVRSAAIPQRLGFILEGRLRQVELRNDELHDFLIFGLLRSDWVERGN